MPHRSADEVLYGPPEDDGWESDDEATTTDGEEEENDLAKLVEARQAEDGPTRNAPEPTGQDLRHSPTIDPEVDPSHRSPHESLPSPGESEQLEESEWRDRIRQKAKLAIDSIIIAHGMRKLQGASDLWTKVADPATVRVSKASRHRKSWTMSEERMDKYIRQARDYLTEVSILQSTGGIETSVREVSGHDLYRHACGVVDGVLNERLLDGQFKADLMETLECGTLIDRSGWETFHQWCTRNGKPDFSFETEDKGMNKARDEAWCCWWNEREDMASEPLDQADRELFKFQKETSAPHVRTEAEEQHLTNLQRWVHGYEAAYRLLMDHDPVVLPRTSSEEPQEDGQSDSEKDEETAHSQVSSQAQELSEAPAAKGLRSAAPTKECEKCPHVGGKTTLNPGGPLAEDPRADGSRRAALQTTRGSSAQNTSQTDETNVQTRSRLRQALGRFMTWLDC